MLSGRDDFVWTPASEIWDGMYEYGCGGLLFCDHGSFVEKFVGFCDYLLES